MKTVDLIIKNFSKSSWFNRVENGYNKREFIIYVNRYPFNDESKIHSFAKDNKIKISIIVLG